MVLVVLVACKGGEESGSENIGCLPGAESAYLKLDIQGAEPGTIELDYQELHACSGWYDSETFLLTWADPSTYVVDVKVGETIPGPAAQSSTMAYLTLWESGEYWHSAVEGGEISTVP